MLDHIQFVFHHNIIVKQSGLFSERKVEHELKMALHGTVTCAALSVLLITTAN